MERALGWVHVTGIAQSVANRIPFPVGMAGAAISYLCVGIYEELAFRGYVLRNLAEGLRGTLRGARPAVIAAWLLSAVIFGLAHGGNPGATWVSNVQLMLAGLFLGLGYLLTGELAVPIGLHIAWNFFQGAVFGFPVSGVPQQVSLFAISQGGPDLWTGGPFGPEAGLMGLLALILGSALIWGWARLRGQSGRPVTRLAAPSLLEERAPEQPSLPLAQVA